MAANEEIWRGVRFGDFEVCHCLCWGIIVLVFFSPLMVDWVLSVKMRKYGRIIVVLC